MNEKDSNHVIKVLVIFIVSSTIVLSILGLFPSNNQFKESSSSDDVPLDQDEVNSEAELLAQLETDIELEEAKNLVGEAYRTGIYRRYPSIQYYSCYDSDGGKNFEKFGRVTATYTYYGIKRTSIFSDICYGDTLKEYYCRDKRYSSTYAACDYGCENGACKPTPACTDTDANSNFPDGKNYFEKGTVSTGGEEWTDFCYNYDKGAGCEGNEEGCVLAEHSCKYYWDDTYGYGWKEKYDCPDGCKDGACVDGICGNEICEKGEADDCPVCEPGDIICSARPCLIGTCPKDCEVEKSVCGNNICEKGEADDCPVGGGPCTIGTCPTDCNK